MLVFVVASFAITWTLQLLALQLGFGADGPPAAPMPALIALMTLAGISPSLVALALAARQHGGVRAGFRALCGPAGGSGTVLLLAAFGLFMGLKLVVAGVLAGLGKGAPSLDLTPLALVAVIIPPFGEELGWRGLAQGSLAPRMGALRAALVVGLIWSLWHLPTAFLPGATLAAFPIYMLRVIAGAVIIAWLYELAGRRIGVAIAAHMGINAGFIRRVPGPLGDWLLTGSIVLVAVACAYALACRESNASAHAAPAYH